jgi:hypothetical protein
LSPAWFAARWRHVDCCPAAARGLWPGRVELAVPLNCRSPIHPSRPPCVTHLSSPPHLSLLPVPKPAGFAPAFPSRSLGRGKPEGAGRSAGRCRHLLIFFSRAEVLLGTWGAFPSLLWLPRGRGRVIEPGFAHCREGSAIRTRAMQGGGSAAGIRARRWEGRRHRGPARCRRRRGAAGTHTLQGKVRHSQD